MTNNSLYRMLSTLLAMIFLIGCGSSKYTPPTVISLTPDFFSQTFDKSYDSIWSAVIKYIGTSPFHIDNFEKASGLITLSFTSTIPSELVSGGHWESKGSKDFSGDYVEYLMQQAETYLSGTMNIMVAPMTSDRTSVSVKASYTFTATIPDERTYTWSFDTGGSDTRFVSNGISSSRDTITIVPTYRIEKSILNALDGKQ